RRARPKDQKAASQETACRPVKQHLVEDDLQWPRLGDTRQAQEDGKRHAAGKLATALADILAEVVPDPLDSLPLRQALLVSQQLGGASTVPSHRSAAPAADIMPGTLSIAAITRRALSPQLGRRRTATRARAPRSRSLTRSRSSASSASASARLSSGATTAPASPCPTISASSPTSDTTGHRPAAMYS